MADQAERYTCPLRSSRPVAVAAVVDQEVVLRSFQLCPKSSLPVAAVAVLKAGCMFHQRLRTRLYLRNDAVVMSEERTDSRFVLA